MAKLAIVSMLVLSAIAPIAAAADEAKTPVSAVMLLNILSAPVESRQSAFDKALREDGPPPRPTIAGEVIDEGTVRYGKAVVTIKNPCPPGTVHYDPPPLPGRRNR